MRRVLLLAGLVAVVGCSGDEPWRLRTVYEVEGPLRHDVSSYATREACLVAMEAAEFSTAEAYHQWRPVVRDEGLRHVQTVFLGPRGTAGFVLRECLVHEEVRP